MLLRQVIELFDLLDTPAANGTTVTDLFKERGNVEVTVENVKGDETFDGSVMKATQIV